MSLTSTLSWQVKKVLQRVVSSQSTSRMERTWSVHISFISDAVIKMNNTHNMISDDNNMSLNFGEATMFFIDVFV